VILQLQWQGELAQPGASSASISAAASGCSAR
jgi:hypothetical protein